jgi:uncharacterized protein YbbC (DUF1343 family)
VHLHVTDRRLFDPLRAGLEILAAADALWPGQLTFSPGHFDLLAGSGRLRAALQAGAAPADIVAGWDADLRQFAEVRAPYLLY